MEAHKVWDLENEMKQILSQLKITDLDAKMGTLSGDRLKELHLPNCLRKPVQSTAIRFLLWMSLPTTWMWIW